LEAAAVLNWEERPRRFFLQTLLATFGDSSSAKLQRREPSETFFTDWPLKVIYQGSTMYDISMSLFFVAFQGVCYGVPGHVFPRPRLPVDFLKEYRAEKRTARCTPEQYDKHKSCAYFKRRDFCSEKSKYHNWMKENCYATCGNCAMPPTPPPKPARCTPEQYDKHKSCAKFKARNFCSEKNMYHNWMQENCYATCGNCAMPPTPTTPPPKVDINACIQAHNAKRARHGAAPLVWDVTLARHAKEWAEVLARRGKSEHARGTGEGENLYRYKSYGSIAKVATCVDAVKSWYGEEPDYPYNNPPKTFQEFYGGKKIGHFTQIVWKGTRKVGVALATKKADGWTETYIVARYHPRGNILGHFAANVARPRR